MITTLNSILFTSETYEHNSLGQHGKIHETESALDKIPPHIVPTCVGRNQDQTHTPKNQNDVTLYNIYMRPNLECQSKILVPLPINT